LKRPILFVVRFSALLFAMYVIVALEPVDRAVIQPFTASIATVSTAVLRAVGEQLEVQSTVMRSGSFGVNVQNGCNGVEAIVLIVAAMIAFPSSLRAKLAGIALGFGAIQLFNILRVVTLFWIGKYHPALFEAFHLAVWQIVMMLFSFALFVAWSRYAGPSPAVLDRR
jgi:exosortase H (IPTLxxWG-CTERM-specific)